MQRWIACFLIVAMLTGLTACGGGGTSSTPAPTGSTTASEGGDTTASAADTTTATEETGTPVTNESGETVTDPQGSIVTNPPATTASGSTASPTSGGVTTAAPTKTPNTTGQNTTHTPDRTNPTSVPDTPTPPKDVYQGIVPSSAQAGTSFANISKAPADKAVTVTNSTKQFGRFLITTADNAGLPFNVACYVNDSTVSAVLPAGTDLSRIKVNFTYYGAKVLYNGAEAVSRQTVFNFTKPVTLTLQAKDGSTKAVTVTIETLHTGLPSVSLATDNYAAITSKTEYIGMGLYVGGGDKSVCSYAATTAVRTTGSVKGRGNTTWVFDKKGYTVRLDTQKALLDMGASKDWVLLALHQDKSLLRNYTAAYLSEQLGLPYTMKVRPVDMWLNGSYVGTYALVEKIELEESRVNITKFDPAAAVNKVGYILEFDAHINDVPASQKNAWKPIGKGYYDSVENETFIHLTTIGDYWIIIRQPAAKNLKAEHVNYIYAVLENAMKALKSGKYSDMAAYLDVDSFAKWYVLEELMNNPDAAMKSSVYMYLDVGGKLTMGPVWDFDTSSGNSNASASTSAHPLYDSANGWFSYLFKCSEARAMVKTNWNKLHGIVNNVGSMIDRSANMLEASAELNFKRWNILNKAVGSNPTAVVQANTYAKQVALLKEYLSARNGALNTFISGL